ncbi:MAG: hypothetical protein ACTSWE_14075 [Promethearchaeota archaeon]
MDLQKNRINEKMALDSLIYFLEHGDTDEIRVESLKAIKKVNYSNEKLFVFLEYLMISDIKEEIRKLSFKILVSKYPKEKIIKPLLYAIQNEKNALLIQLVEYLARINGFLCKISLIKKLLSLEPKYLEHTLDHSYLMHQSLGELQLILLRYLFNKSSESLYFHRRKIVLALDEQDLDLFIK